MAELIFVSQLLGSVAGLICLVWGARYFYRMYINKKLTSEIKKLSSRISVLKLMLRARLRKNCNNLSKIFRGETTLLEMFQSKYETIANFDLNSADHYPKIIGTLNEIAHEAETFFEKKYRSAADTIAHHTKTQEQNAHKEEKVIEFEHLINFDLSSLLMIREIVINQASSRILVEKFNLLQKTKKEELDVPFEIKFESQEILFDLIDRAHEKKKLEKSLESDNDLHNEPNNSTSDASTESKSA